MQADPHIDGATQVGGFNRYAYLKNNPLNSTDPTGFFNLEDEINNGLQEIKPYTGAILFTAFAFMCPACLTQLVPLLTMSLISAGGNAVVNNLPTAERDKSLLKAGLSSAAFFGLGQIFAQVESASIWLREGGVLHIASHATLGGIISDLDGGKFAHGFWSAGITKGLTPYFAGIGNTHILGINVTEALIAGLLGGTISDLTGGKFASGFYTTLFANIFNEQKGGGRPEAGRGPNYSPEQVAENIAAVVGTEAGDNAAQHWADRVVNSEWYEDPVARAGLFFSVLWTDETAANTAFTLGTGGLAALHAARPFWQYYPAGNAAYSSTWVTRGLGWKPPYPIGSVAASKLALPAYNPATAVRAANIPWYKFVWGPRTVAPQPTFGAHATGGGIEYRLIPFWK